MRCIYCSADTNYKHRQANGGRCAGCRHPFAFEPKTNPFSMTDVRFQRAIKDVSADGAVFFTERNLFYELNRRVSRRPFWRAPWGWVAAGCGAGALVAVAQFSAFWFLPIAAAGVIGSGIKSHRESKRAPLPLRIGFETFQESYLPLWQAVHGEIEKLVATGDAPSAPRPAPRADERSPGAQQATAPDVARGAASGAPPAPDLTAYSFDRALVTNRAETAAMLIANNFHFENNCAILSISGYPEGVFDTVMTMLGRNPELKVFAVHDASIPGCDLIQRLRAEGWFPDPAIRIVDLGLKPRDAIRLRLPILDGMPTPVPDALRQALGAEDAEWLASGKAAELAAMRPAKLMRSIYQGFARASQIDAAAGTEGGDGIFIWGYDPGAGVYAADSFG